MEVWGGVQSLEGSGGMALDKIRHRAARREGSFPQALKGLCPESCILIL